MIELKNSTDFNEWNSFLEKESENQMITLAHNPSLGEVLAKTFGYKNQNYLLKNSEEVVGVFPAITFRDRVVSMPHFSYGGPIWANNEKIDVDLSSLLKGKKYEIRSFSQLSEHYSDQKLSCVLNINETADEQLMGLKSKLRQKIRKAEKLNFNIKHGGIELLDEFYESYACKMLLFGSPPIGKVFFKNLLTDYQFGEVLVSVMYEGDKVIAAAMSLSYLGFFEVCWSATESEYNKFNIHALICWDILKYALEKKYVYFSFGRSTVNSNNHRFKKQWNPMELKIYYNYSEPIGKSIRDYGFLTKIWKQQPLKTSIYFGHKISKHVY